MRSGQVTRRPGICWTFFTARFPPQLVANVFFHANTQNAYFGSSVRYLISVCVLISSIKSNSESTGKWSRGRIHFALPQPTLFPNVSPLMSYEYHICQRNGSRSRRIAHLLNFVWNCRSLLQHRGHFKNNNTLHLASTNSPLSPLKRFAVRTMGRCCVSMDSVSSSVPFHSSKMWIPSKTRCMSKAPKGKVSIVLVTPAVNFTLCLIHRCELILCGCS